MPREPKSSRCRLLEMTPAVPARLRSSARRSASQAPPLQTPTRAMSGCSRRCHAATQVGYRASASSKSPGHRGCLQELFRIMPGCAPTSSARAPGSRPRPRCSARPPRTPAGGSARAGGGEAQRLLGHSCGAPSGWRGTPPARLGCHSAPGGRWRRRRIALATQAGRNGLHAPIGRVPEATPMRRVPKSKARKDWRDDAEPDATALMRARVTAEHAGSMPSSKASARS